MKRLGKLVIFPGKFKKMVKNLTMTNLLPRFYVPYTATKAGSVMEFIDRVRSVIEIKCRGASTL